MRVSSVDSLLTNNNITIDEQIKFYNSKNSSQEGFSDEIQGLSKADREHQRFMNLLEKQRTQALESSLTLRCVFTIWCSSSSTRHRLT